MKKLLGSLGIVVALGAGAFAISSVLPAGAQSSTPSTPPASSDGSGGSARGGHDVRAKAVKDALDNLVTSGVISQDQENAVISALKDALEPTKGRRFGHLRARIGVGMVKVAADKIGVEPKDLIEARRNGQSIADVASSKNVNPNDVVSAIVDAGNQRIDEAVSEQRLDQERADALKAKLPQLADAFVNAKGPWHGSHDGAAPSAGSPDSSSSSTESSSSSS